MLNKVRDFIWPRMGWRRYLLYLRHKLGRMQGTSYSIAAGFAAGASMSMTPFMGFHFLLSALLAWLIRGNLLASAIGTAVGNPWTFPLIWMSSYEVGCWILGLDPRAAALKGHTVAEVMADPLQILAPMLTPMVVGSLPMAVAMFILAYWPVATVVERYRQKRRDRRHRRLQAMMERMAGLGGGLDTRGE